MRAPLPGRNAGGKDGAVLQDGQKVGCGIQRYVCKREEGFPGSYSGEHTNAEGRSERSPPSQRQRRESPTKGHLLGRYVKGLAEPEQRTRVRLERFAFLVACKVVELFENAKALQLPPPRPPRSRWL